MKWIYSRFTNSKHTKSQKVWLFSLSLLFLVTKTPELSSIQRPVLAKQYSLQTVKNMRMVTGCVGLIQTVGFFIRCFHFTLVLRGWRAGHESSTHGSSMNFLSDCSPASLLFHFYFWYRVCIRVSKQYNAHITTPTPAKILFENNQIRALISQLWYLGLSRFETWLVSQDKKKLMSKIYGTLLDMQPLW